MSKLYWIGPRESDIRHTGEIFAGSITLYGSGSSGNRDFCSYVGRRINHNIVTEEQIQFVYDEQIKIMEDPDSRFMSYNPILCYESPDVRVIKERTDCLNSKELLQELENKRKFRELAGQTVKVLQSRVLKGKECDFKKLAGIYNFKADSLGIIQKIEGATGGHGTYLLSRGGAEAAESILPEEDYLVSEYLTPNVPINLHVLIYEKDIVILPPSIQLIHQRHGRMLYFGGDYIAYSKIDAAIDRKFKEGARELCSVLKDRGYRGILGLDAIIYNGDVLFLEINPRFQGSSPDLNRALWERGCPSLQELNLQAFDSDSPRPGRAELESLSVYYGSFYFGGTHKEHLDFVYRNSIGEPTVTEFLGDGCDAVVKLRRKMRISSSFNLRKAYPAPTMETCVYTRICLSQRRNGRPPLPN